MAKGNFPACLADVLVHEGGYVDHPKDPGGATNLGITIGTLTGWLGRQATKAEVKALTKTTVAPIYRAKYWDKVRGDDLPSGLDAAVFDFAVNSGPGRAAKLLQRLVGVPQDGEIGPMTLAAVAKAPDIAALINAYCDARMTFLRGLGTFDTFGRGWTRRVDGVRAKSLQMAKDGVSLAPAPVPAQPTKRQPAAIPQRSPLAAIIAVALALGGAVYAFLKSNGVVP